mmetsp:Transcript_121168/g.314642  ORF Transcript_121168/g.314642 Transcript_121168/m.314642 type:complete len:292 (-) Transcript_121168:485-1360(-)
MLSPRLEWMLGCCSCAGCDAHVGQAELQVQLSSDFAIQSARRHLLTRGDSFDITFTPRSLGDGEPRSPHQAGGRPGLLTPRQRDLRDNLELPSLNTYPVAPSCTSDDGEEERRTKLLAMYQEFALDLHTGMYLTQLTSNRDYSDIHCQLMEDMTTLKLDQSNGRIIEFPLTNVSKVYRIVKNDDKFYTPGTVVPSEKGAKSEHIVVVEFLRRKLAFVYKEVAVAQRFMICMELLIRRAQQKQALRSLTPTFPPRHAQASHGQCPTPRQVYEAMSRTAPPSPAASAGPDRSL